MCGEPVYRDWAAKMWPFMGWERRESGECTYNPGYAPRHRVPGSLPYSLLVLQFGNSGGPLVNLVSGTSFFPRIPAPGQCGKGWVSLIQRCLVKLLSSLLLAVCKNPVKPPQLPYTPRYSCSGLPISYYLFGLGNSGLCHYRMGR